MSDRIVIVGGGHCAGQAVVALRQQGFEGELVLVGAEAHPPYQRPPLSKRYLEGALGRERVYFRPPEFYEKQGVVLRLGCRAESIEPDARAVRLADGETVHFDRLLLATGSRPRRIPVPGADLPGVHYLRSIDDADAIRADLGADRRLVVVGGGFIGLEVAAVGVALGMRVTVLEGAERLLGRVTSPEMSDYFARAHRARGVDVRLGVGVSAFEGAGRVERVVCGDDAVEADAVVVGVGVEPNVELAAAAGLACEDGIVVDTRCRTSAPGVFAAGDCTRHPNPVLGTSVRLESVHNAIEQGRTAAANLAGGDAEYAEVPWFWSDQFDLKLQMVGLSAGHDRVVRRGSMDDDAFALFYLADGALIAVDAVNTPREFMACRKLVPERPRIAPERLADPSIPMQEMLDA